MAMSETQGGSMLVDDVGKPGLFACSHARNRGCPIAPALVRLLSPLADALSPAPLPELPSALLVLTAG
jgi:hypothetical protein